MADLATIWGVEDSAGPTGFADAAGRTAGLLGGARVLRCAPLSALDTHDLLLGGLPGEALSHLTDHLIVLSPQSLEKALGMSLRTVQRCKDAPYKTLNHDQSGRAWKFAEILTRATDVFGTQEAAERWLDTPAMGLDGRRPLDLLATPAGLTLVENFLTRLEYGVYS